MQLVVSGNRVLATGTDCFVCMGGTVVCTETGRVFQNATVVTDCSACPSDIDTVAYEYHEGDFVPCATQCKTFSATITNAWQDTTGAVKQEIEVDGLLETDNAIIDWVPSSTDATAKAEQLDIAQIYSAVTGNNKITLYARRRTGTINILIKVVR